MLSEKAQKILPLPTKVIAQIKSSAVVTNLNAVIQELVQNSLDANSSKITVEVDFGRGSCAAEDDGVGIEPREFDIEGGLGKLHRGFLKILTVN
jgi:DNA mismatch repair protein MLH3